MSYTYLSMYSSALENITRKAPQHSLYHTPVLGRRKARHSQAGHFLWQAYGAKPRETGHLFIPHKETKILPQTYKDPSKQRIIENSDFLFTVHNDIILTLFPDQSAFLARREGTKLRVLPEILGLRSDLKNKHFLKEKLIVTSAPKHGLYIHGPELMKMMYKPALFESMTFWANILDTLPPISDPRQKTTGFYPSFAPVPPIEENKLQKTKAILTCLTTLLSTHFDCPLRLDLYGLTLDRDRINKKPKHILYHQNKTPIKERPLNTWLKQFYLHPNFPLQGTDWLVPNNLAISKNTYFDRIATVKATPLKSAHDKLAILSTLEKQFGFTPQPLDC